MVFSDSSSDESTAGITELVSMKTTKVTTEIKNVRNDITFGSAEDGR